MSREIKFRAWETTSKEMFYQVRCGGMFDNMATVPTTWNGSDWVHLTGGEFTKVMQYTGLEDQNGVDEIYEGDIIQEGGWDGIYIVEFEEGKYIGRKIRKPNGDIFTNYNHDLDWFVYPIIIGNIYENPELLKAQPN